ncbi:MAG: hypothetical protein ACKO6A_04800 [Bacteroidota bacterium]
MIGVLVVVRIIGRILIAKRNLDKERELMSQERDLLRKKEFIQRNEGKTSIVGKQKISAEDTDFKELN